MMHSRIMIVYQYTLVCRTAGTGLSALHRAARLERVAAAHDGGALARKLFGTPNDRRVKGYQSRVNAINALEGEVEKLTDEQLKARTDEFRKELAEGKTLDDILVPAFATVREAAKRTLGQRHFDVQLIGGMVLHEGDIAEMKTGEGKTLVATLAVYLNALAGRGVHVVTVNDYLARRDAAWMGQIYSFLGMTTGVIVHGLDDAERKQAYACDITYGTNNEYGFDYLRDNMKYRLEDMVQRSHFYAIVDEVDSILIDEARTPLIISGPLDDRSDFYNTIDTFMPKLERKTDYEVDEKQRAVTLTEGGMEKIETLLREAGQLKGESLYDVENVTVVHHVNQALKAHKLFQRDRDYIVKGGEVVIIDEFTGRMMPGRRYSEGLHQALEAKEGVAIQPDNKIVATGMVAIDNKPKLLVARYTADGKLDTTFNGKGYATLLSPQGFSNSQASGIKLQPDGKIVVAGNSDGVDGASDVFVARYNANGTLDTTFAGKGYTRLDIDGTATVTNEVAFNLAIQPDGKIVVVGREFLQSDTSTQNVVVARFNSDGTPDAGFGSGGIKLSAAPAGHAFYTDALLIQSDGDIIAAGYYFDGSISRPLMMRFYGSSSSPLSGTTDSTAATTSSTDTAAAADEALMLFLTDPLITPIKRK